MMGRFGHTMKKIFILSLFIFTYSFGQVDYQTQIQTIFNNSCTSCHINGGAYYGGLDLSSYDSLMTGSNNGDVVVAGDHANSLLWQKVNSGEMPPQNNPDLSTDEVSLIAQWIDEGAIWTPACPINCNSDCYPWHLGVFAASLSVENYSTLFDIDYNGRIDIIDLLIFSDILLGYSDYYDCSD